MEKKKGQEVASAGAHRVRRFFRVLRAARDGVLVNCSARTAPSSTSLCSYVYYSGYGISY